MRLAHLRWLPLALLAAFAAAPAPAIASPEGEGVVAEAAPDPLFDEDFEELEPDVYDPFEGGNRAIYHFNRSFDRWIAEPVFDVYRFAVPTPGRLAVRRVLGNFNTPIYVVNHLLQLHPERAAETLVAFAMNMSFGVVGIFDAAGRVGLELEESDFGQTLALVGVGSGPYLMVPILGPMTLRDGFGGIVDRAFHPMTYFLAIPTQLMWGGGLGAAHFEAMQDQLHALEDSALDPYSVLRSAYVQARERAIEESRREGALAAAF